MVGIGGVLVRIAHIDPCKFDFTTLNLTVNVHNVLVAHRVNRTRWQFPNFLTDGSVFGDGNVHVRWKSVGKGSYLTRRATRTRLSCKRERTVSGFGLFAKEEMHHVGLLIDPCSTLVLVKAHRPEANDFSVFFDVKIG